VHFKILAALSALALSCAVTGTAGAKLAFDVQARSASAAGYPAQKPVPMPEFDAGYLVIADCKRHAKKVKASCSIDSAHIDETHRNKKFLYFTGSYKTVLLQGRNSGHVEVSTGDGRVPVIKGIHGEHFYVRRRDVKP
jgi:hypothetical protein